MTHPLINTNFNINDYKNIYFGLKKKNLIKKRKLRKTYIKNILKTVIKNIKRNLKFYIKRKYKKRNFKPWYKIRLMRSKPVTINQLRSLHFLYGSLLNFKIKKKYKKRIKRFLIGPSRLRIIAAGRERPRFISRRFLIKTPFMRRFSFIRLPRLFFF